MQLAAIDTNRLNLGNRSYPLCLRQGEQKWPPEFAKLKKALLPRLEPSKQKALLFQDYSKGLTSLQKAHTGLDRFLKSVCSAQLPLSITRWCRYCDRNKLKSELTVRDANSGLWKCGRCQCTSEDGETITTYAPATPRKTFPLLPLKLPQPFGVELAVSKTPEDIHMVLLTALDATTDFLIAEVIETLDEMVEEKYAGLISWMGPKECRYHYITSTDVTEVTDQRRREEQRSGRVQGGTLHIRKTTTETDKERRVTLTYNEHDLLEAERKPVSARSVVPPRVKPLIERGTNTPGLLGSLSIVEGIQITSFHLKKTLSVERWTEKDAREEQWFVSDPPTQTWHPDPAIVLCNHFVLAGWLPEEK